jgi:hypothetical protein
MQEFDENDNAVNCYQEYVCPYPYWGDAEVAEVSGEGDESCDECLSIAVGYTNNFVNFSGNPSHNPCTKDVPFSNSSIPISIDNFNRMLFTPYGSVNGSVTMAAGEPVIHLRCSNDDDDHCAGDHMDFSPIPLSHLDKDTCHLTLSSFDPNGFCYSTYICRFQTYAPPRLSDEVQRARIIKNHQNYEAALRQRAARLAAAEQEEDVA